MAGPIERDFAGELRVFMFLTGDFIDVEESTGAAIGTLYKRIATHDYYVSDVVNILVRGLVGGGMSPDKARALVRRQIDHKPLETIYAIASDVFLEALTGLPQNEGENVDAQDDSVMAVGSLFRSMAQLGIPPQDVRDMRLDDLMKTLMAGKPDKTAPPSEAEFDELIARYNAMKEPTE